DEIRRRRFALVAWADEQRRHDQFVGHGDKVRRVNFIVLVGPDACREANLLQVVLATGAGTATAPASTSTARVLARKKRKRDCCCTKPEDSQGDAQVTHY